LSKPITLIEHFMGPRLGGGSGQNRTRERVCVCVFTAGQILGGIAKCGLREVE